MQHSKSRIANEVGISVVREPEPDDDNLPITVMTAVSVPAWKTPSTIQDNKTTRGGETPDLMTGADSSPFASSVNPDADLLDLDETSGENKFDVADAVILAEKNVKPSLWTRLVSLVSQYSPRSMTDSDLSKINLYLCAGGLLIAIIIFIFVVLK